jgi:phosphohistidine phosphatase
MNLYIIRHAIAVESTDSYSEEDDLQRPLTDKGRDRMRKIVQGLWELDVQPGLVLTSPATRTMDTARIVGSRLGVKKDKVIATDHLLPNGYADELIKEINEKYAEVESLALVGHEPYLSGLISVLLSGGADMSIILKKGGVCHLSLDTLQYGKCATLHWLMAPAQLVYIGENS